MKNLTVFFSVWPASRGISTWPHR